MAASVPVTARPTDCCSTSCEDVTISQVPGPAGAAGAAGTNGTDGVDAFTTTNAQFVMPAVAATVNVTVLVSEWAAVGQVVFVTGAGYFTVDAVPDATHITLRNLGYTGNVAPTTVVPTAQQVSPGGLIGPTGSSGASTLNGISPTTTKGDLMVDNGANSPAASVIRLAVGTDGQVLAAVSTQPSGQQWRTVAPNAATDNAIARFDGASGTPVPTQTSKVIINDQGAIQASGSGGNARGTDAVDLQVTRANVLNVASGVRAFIGAGSDNRASGQDSAIPGGNANIADGVGSSVSGGTQNESTASNAAIGGGSANLATASNSTVGGGSSNSATAGNATVSGGNSNTASGSFSTVSGGELNSATGSYSAIPGGSQAVANKFGQIAHSSGSFAAPGDAQSSEFIWFIETTDATAGVEMFLDGATARATVPVDTSWVFEILVIGRSGAGSAAWRVTGAITNTAGVTTVVAAASVSVLADGTGGTWGVAGSVAVTADNTNDSLKVAVTGAAATTIRWVAHARTAEVTFG